MLKIGLSSLIRGNRSQSRVVFGAVIKKKIETKCHNINMCDFPFMVMWPELLVPDLLSYVFEVKNMARQYGV